MPMIEKRSFSYKIYPADPPCNNFTQDPNDNSIAMASENKRKSKKSVIICPSSKRPYVEVAGSTLSETSMPAKAVTFVSTSSENPWCEKVTPLPSSETPMLAEFTPPASNKNATTAEVAVFASSRNKTLAEIVFAVPGELPTPAPTCSENPHFFSGLDYIDALLSLANSSEATHSEIIRPCERESAHSRKPYHVCLDCRNLATRHIVKTTPKLMEPKFLPMCIECGHEAKKQLMLQRSSADGQWSGCRCAAKWLCVECRIEEYEWASARKEGEMEWRMDVNPFWGSEAEVSHCNFKLLSCLCGVTITKRSSVYRCVGCEEFVMGRIS